MVNTGNVEKAFEQEQQKNRILTQQELKHFNHKYYGSSRLVLGCQRRNGILPRGQVLCL